MKTKQKSKSRYQRLAEPEIGLSECGKIFVVIVPYHGEILVGGFAGASRIR